MRNIFFSLALLLVSFKVFSQNLLLINQNSGKPITDVFAYSDEKSFTALSDNAGIISLENFPKNANIILTHPSFKKAIFSFEKLKENGFKVLMKERILEFDEIIIAANKWEQDIKEVPHKIAKIDAKNIEFNNPPTSADLLSQSGQVYVQKSQLGGGSPMLRGFSASSVLLVMDGVRMNNAIYRSGNLQNVISIDPNSIESTEVIFGPGSVIYGSDALGGVMNFKSKEPKFNSTKEAPKVNSFLRYGSAANEKTGHMDIKASGTNVAYFGSFSYSDFGDLRAGKNRSEDYEGFFERNFFVAQSNGEDILVKNKNPETQKFSGYSSFNVLNKLKIKTGEKTSLTYGFNYSSTSDIPRYDALTETINNTDSLQSAEWYYGPQKWFMHSLNFSNNNRNRLFNRSNAILAFQQYEESRNDRDFGEPSLRTRTENVDLLTINLSFDKQFVNSSLYYGIDFSYNYVTSKAKRTDIITNEESSTSTRYPDGGSKYGSSAIYGNYVHRLNPKWLINIGGRLNDVHLSAKTNNNTASDLLVSNISQANQAINGSSGVIFTPSETTKWNLTFSTGFRAPNVDDVGKVFDIGTVITVPNPDLKPEYSYSQELGFSKQTDHFQFNVVGFHSFLTNAIVTDEFQLNGLSTYSLEGETYNIEAQVNSGKAIIYGGSLNLKSILNAEMALIGNVTYTEGYEIDSKEPLRHIPPIFGQISFLFKREKIQAEGSSVYNFSKGKNDIPTVEFENKPHLYTGSGSPGWLTLNIKISYNINQWLVAQGSIENVFDIHYRPYSSGISAPGRNISLTLRTSF